MGREGGVLTGKRGFKGDSQGFFMVERDSEEGGGDWQGM